MSLRIEGRVGRAELVHDAAEGPNVRGGGVFLSIADLGRHVERRANVCGCEVVRGHDLRETEIAELDGVVFAEKDWIPISQVLRCLL